LFSDRDMCNIFSRRVRDDNSVVTICDQCDVSSLENAR